MSKTCEDGIWIGRYGNGEGNFGVRFLVKERSFARRLPDGTYSDVSFTFLPLNRVADLDGRPVVDEAVIEAIAKDIHKTEKELLGTSLLIEELTDILRERLAAFTPAYQPTTEGDGLTEFLRKLGAFPCWDEAGIKLWAWKCPGGYSVLCEDGSVRSYTAKSFDQFFTRTPPAPLSPELESLVKPLAEKLGKTETEVRGAILEAQGAGA